MKTLGGVGAVVLGGMLLLTVRIGPAEPLPGTSRSSTLSPTDVVAAVPDAPPRSTPAAAAPVPAPAMAAQASEPTCVVSEKVVKVRAVRVRRVQHLEAANANWTWAVSLPRNPLCL